ncbi:hypothetical protein CHUAL_008788 [Chamberlinius hualienensis]
MASTSKMHTCRVSLILIVAFIGITAYFNGGSIYKTISNLIHKCPLGDFLDIYKQTVDDCTVAEDFWSLEKNDSMFLFIGSFESMLTSDKLKLKVMQVHECVKMTLAKAVPEYAIILYDCISNRSAHELINAADRCIKDKILTSLEEC